jgi:chemotaxis protein CheX
MMGANPALTSGSHEGWLPVLQLATREVFELMLASPLHLPSEPPSEQGLDITSMVGLAGRLCGVLTLRCSAATAARMAARMLGIGVEQAGPEIWDAVGEVCNMVAGNFKNKISGLGDGCLLSVPTVIADADYPRHAIVNHEIRTVLIFEGEPIVLCLEIHSQT